MALIKLREDLLCPRNARGQTSNHQAQLQCFHPSAPAYHRTRRCLGGSQGERGSSLGERSKARRRGGVGRREFLARSCFWASAGLMASPLRSFSYALPLSAQRGFPVNAVDARLIPHYRQPASIDAILRQVEPGSDAFITEKYAEQIEAALAKWTTALTQSA